MKLYQKLICPILYYPGQSYEPKKKYLEDPVVWYPEDMHEELLEKYKHLNTTFNNVSFEYKYEPYVEKPKFKKLKVPEKCDDCQSCSSSITADYAYCRMESITQNSTKDPGMTQIVNTGCITDINKRPEWCPIIKINRELDLMPIDRRAHLDMLITGLSELFGSADQWEDCE